MRESSGRGSRRTRSYSLTGEPTLLRDSGATALLGCSAPAGASGRWSTTANTTVAGQRSSTSASLTSYASAHTRLDDFVSRQGLVVEPLLRIDYAHTKQNPWSKA
jgi:hypothetical protein